MKMIEVEERLGEERRELAAYERVATMARGNAVVVFGMSGCCMCHVVKRLLQGLGVGPTVYELDRLDDSGGSEIKDVLSALMFSASNDNESGGGNGIGISSPATAVVPAVFVGGKLLGGVEKVMACHINGSLVPLLKQAGALWL